MSETYRRNVLELTLDAVRGDGPWNRDRGTAQRLLIATLTWPRPMIAERVSTRAYTISARGMDLAEQTWTERIFFKETVEGPFGLTVQVTEAMTAVEAKRVMGALGAAMLRAAGPEAARWAAGPLASAVARVPFTHLAGLMSEAGKTPAVEAAGAVTLQPGRGGAIEVPLQVPEPVVRMRRIRSGGQTRTRREVLHPAGEPAGSAHWTAVYYRGE